MYGGVIEMNEFYDYLNRRATKSQQGYDFDWLVGQVATLLISDPKNRYAPWKVSGYC